MQCNAMQACSIVIKQAIQARHLIKTNSHIRHQSRLRQSCPGAGNIMALPRIPSPPPPPRSPATLSCLPSLSGLFLSCISSRKSKSRAKDRRPPKDLDSNTADPACQATTTTTRTCGCTSPPPPPPHDPVYTIPKNELDAPHTVSISQTTSISNSIRIVDSDSSSDYSSSSTSHEPDSEADGFSVSDYECTCNGGNHEKYEKCLEGFKHADGDEYLGHACDDYTEIVLGQSQDQKARPLPPIPVRESSLNHTARKQIESRPRLFEETIPEEDEDAYLEDEKSKSQAQSAAQAKHKRTTSRRKSMIELLNLPSLSSSSSSSKVSTAPGLSVSFSNLHFKFPMPPFGRGQQKDGKQDNDPSENGAKNEETSQTPSLRQRRPMSMSALPVLSSGSSSSLLSSATPATSTSSLKSPETSIKQRASHSSLKLHRVHAQSALPPTEAAPTTKKERRMGTIVLPPLSLSFLSRSSMGSTFSRDRDRDRDSAASLPGTSTGHCIGAGNSIAGGSGKTASLFW